MFVGATVLVACGATVLVAAGVVAMGAAIVWAAVVLVASPLLLPLLRPQAPRASNAIIATTANRATDTGYALLIDLFPQLPA